MAPSAFQNFWQTDPRKLVGVFGGTEPFLHHPALARGQAATRPRGLSGPLLGPIAASFGDPLRPLLGSLLSSLFSLFSLLSSLLVKETGPGAGYLGTLQGGNSGVIRVEFGGIRMFSEEFGFVSSLDNVAVIAFGAIWNPPKCPFYNIKNGLCTFWGTPFCLLEFYHARGLRGPDQI